MAAKAVVAGHICIDIIPDLEGRAGGADNLVIPGRLVQVGPAIAALGGCVSNTGMALHRLGTDVQLMGKLGDDVLGGATLDLLRRQGEALADGMIVTPGEASSYTIVINPPQTDRSFLHCPGTNDTFVASDVPYESLDGARLFHFGYPTLMHDIFADGGEQMTTILSGAQQRALITSLDMGMPDVNSPAGQVDWVAWLTKVLPHVDVFLPSLDELTLMLDRKRFEAFSQDESPTTETVQAMLDDMATRCLDMGAAVVGLKLGEWGFYLRTGDRAADATGLDSEWNHRELCAPCYQVDVQGTTGSGDTTIAGFLAALLRGRTPVEAVNRAVAVGACCCEAVDAVSGVAAWDAINARIDSGWERLPSLVAQAPWQEDAASGVWHGPHDQAE